MGPSKIDKCAYCGSVTEPMTVFDRRDGRDYRLLKCLSCQKLSWIEDED